ncbi:MAG TPA: ImmA/IrrE family metallo-endopeptidase [Pyrinomonadaceae bacterium]|jgi:Zn-dependent peptidase ImmA (M78 family)|nr:ImmA/IrrE family metallo-endopeptidase [Pyrinomonadaceae bacterium]
MKLSLSRIKNLVPEWNRQTIDFASAEELCSRLGLDIEMVPMSVKGFYFSVMGRHVIAISSRLKKAEQLYVLLHEIGHFILHTPEGNHPAVGYYHVGRRTKKEWEADVFALCALMPLEWIASRQASEIIEEEGIESELVNLRFEVFKRFGI